MPPIKEERPSEDREHQQCDNRETYQDDDKRTVLAIRILSHALKYPWALKSSGLIIVPSSAVVVQVAPPPKGGGQGEKSSCATRTRDSDFVSQHHALLALGWVTALRRSELVGLDCGNVGAGTGYLRIEWKAPPMVGGASTAILYGDPTKPGVYVTRTKFWASRVWTVSAPFWCPVQWLK